ncbi:MAG: hypothetical protein KatS3mg110_3911 [Pirellulaceae bacterium]|nr:MAG: hypothetical protein KatS3mg110_3911 [Pirellulaceae bacterium]
MNEQRLPYVFRYEPQLQDIEQVRTLAESTGNFYPEEIVVAVQLVQEAVEHGAASGYQFVFADGPSGCHGYACFGHIPLTRSSYDLYWIVVGRAWQRQGLGRSLLEAVERRVRAAGGTQLFIDTSGRDQYQATRRFYEAQGYQQAAILPDFYAPGDPKIIYSKKL